MSLFRDDDVIVQGWWCHCSGMMLSLFRDDDVIVQG